MLAAALSSVRVFSLVETLANHKLKLCALVLACYGDREQDPLDKDHGLVTGSIFYPYFFVQTTHRVSNMTISYQTIAEMSLWCVPLEIYFYYEFHTTLPIIHTY